MAQLRSMDAHMFAAIPFRTLPEISVGPLTIRTFGLFVAVGILVGVWLFLRYARDRDLDADLLSRLAWWLIALGIIGSRVLFVATHWGEFSDDPLSMFAIWQGGLQFSGAFLISIIVIVWFSRRHPEMPGLVVSDGVVFGLAPGLAIGRLGCMAVGEHLGGQTGFPLAWKYLGGETREPVVGGVGAVVHNTAMYELFLMVPLVGLLWWMQRRRLEPGWLTVTFLLWYGTQRFLTDFLREYDRTVAGLTGAQYLSIGMVVGGLLLATRLRTRSRRQVSSEVATA
ncbi:MAG TPA: prolipoprotein diacylglyceryl transferase [Actinomycetota bacterium]